jgi:hypothetical protein
VALAGNPECRNSTVFNALAGMIQHTGNWPEKRLPTTQGHFKYGSTFHHGGYSGRLLADGPFRGRRGGQGFYLLWNPDAVEW